MSGTINANNSGSLTLHSTSVGGNVEIGNSRHGSGFDIQNSTIGGSLRIETMAASALPDQVCGTHIEASQGLNLIAKSGRIQIGGSAARQIPSMG